VPKNATRVIRHPANAAAKGNKRGTTEQWIKEGKQAVKMTRLSCHRLRSNEVWLLLTIAACSRGNLWWRLVLPRRVGKRSLTSLLQRMVKTGGRLVKHARYYWLMLAEGHLSRRLFGVMVLRITALPVPDGWAELANNKDDQQNR
jgi:hypothetical protein